MQDPATKRLPKCDGNIKRCRLVPVPSASQHQKVPIGMCLVSVPPEGLIPDSHLHIAVMYRPSVDVERSEETWAGRVIGSVGGV